MRSAWAAYIRLELPAAACLLAWSLLSGCASKPLIPWTPSYEPLTFADSTAQGVVDGRSRFRDILCAVTQAHGEDLPDYMPCEKALTRIEPEPVQSNRPVGLGTAQSDFITLMVPGLGFACVEEWLDYDNAGPAHASRFGFDVRLVDVGPLAGSEHNARQIREYVLDMPAADSARPLVFIGYSKGAPDVLTALAEFPEIARRTVAVVSFAGAVAGSPLANDAKQSWLNLLTKFPRSDCDAGDEGALESLRPEVRKAWLASHELPEHVSYYSVVSFPEPDRISAGLKPSYRKLGKLADARNDSQLVFSDQVIPNSKLLAFVNADHWAMAVPVARQHKIAAHTFATQNAFPREVFLETILRYLDEKLWVTP